MITSPSNAGAGVITGDSAVIEILNMELSEYLNELDKSRGIGRD